MPANIRWDLIQRLKGYVHFAREKSLNCVECGFCDDNAGFDFTCSYF
jgi:hypothetical protein